MTFCIFRCNSNWKPQNLLKERITFKDHLWLKMNVYAYDFTMRFGIRNIWHWIISSINLLCANCNHTKYWIIFLKLSRHWLLIFFSELFIYGLSVFQVIICYITISTFTRFQRLWIFYITRKAFYKIVRFSSNFGHRYIISHFTTLVITL